MNTRRDFITTVATTAAGFMIVPRHVLGRGYQAPSDLVNVAAVGIGGMGAVNTQAVMSQNVVAICDCDLGLLDGKLAEWTKRAHTPPPQRPPAPAEAAGAIQVSRPVESAACGEREMARSGRPGQPHAVRRSADPAPEEVSGLPRDAREAEGPRRDHRRHAGSHARGDRLERDGRRQARLRAEADVLVGARGPAPGEEGQREEGRRAAGQSAAFRRREPPVGRIHPGRRDRRGPRGARLDQPAVRLLAAGRAAAVRGRPTSGRPAGTIARCRRGSPRR